MTQSVDQTPEDGDVVLAGPEAASIGVWWGRFDPLPGPRVA